MAVPKSCSTPRDGLSDSAIDGDELRIFKPGVDRDWICANPEDVGNREVRNARYLTQRLPQEERYFLPSFEKRLPEAILSFSPERLSARGSTFRPASGGSRGTNSSASARCPLLPKTHRRAKEVPEANRVEGTQGYDLVNVAGRSGESLVV